MGSIKKLIGVALVGLVGALALAPAAGAAIEPPTSSPLTCVFEVTPADPVAPVNLAIDGYAPEGSTVKLFLDGAEAPGVPPQVIGSDWLFHFEQQINAPTAVSVNYYTASGSAYATGCATVDGLVVIRVRAAAAALAFTGSNSNTGTYVLVGFAALAVGLVLVVGARRRASVRG